MNSVALRPVGYQFPVARGDAYDDNWLVVEGAVATGDGRRWGFRDACLLTDEARRIGGWLRAVADGAVEPAGGGGGGLPGPEVAFTEPVLGFGLGGWRGGLAVVRVYLSLEAAPRGSGTHAVPVAVDPRGLVRAADEWERELAAFPAR
ncbi:hypothetical protein [Streptomyces sp. NPDC005805]|uniref:WapI family immunity protein n=1 Tax=Streptomyces sp. NPDC005805 TaxID=3157068 RepID=UPI0033F94FB6